jgi:hypothetical protein
VTASLLILDGALRAAAAGRTPSRAVRAWWYGLALFAANSFGTGTAIGIVLPAGLALLLPRDRTVRVPLLSLPVVVLMLYALQAWAYEALSGIDLHYTKGLQFVLSDVRAIVSFGVGLLGYGLTGLLAGPFVPKAASVWYAVLAAFVAAVAVAVVRTVGAERRRLLACMLLVATAYGIIGVGRGAIANFLMSGTLAAVPLISRYHYAGQLFLTLLLSGVVACLAPLRGRTVGTVLAACYAVTAIANLGWSPPIDHHPEAREGTEQTIAAIRSAIAAVPPGETVRIENRPFGPLPFPPVLFPGWAAVFAVFFPDDVVDGRRVQFVERDPAVLKALRRGHRTRSFAVAP